MKKIIVTIFLLSLFVAVPVAAEPIKMTVATVNVEDPQLFLDGANLILPKNLVTVARIVKALPYRTEPFLGPYQSPISRYKAELCPQYGKPGEIIVVLDMRGGVIGMANICLKDRNCTLAYVAINKDQFWESIIAIAHEILHTVGAYHLPGCNIMRSAIINCAGMFKIKKETKKQIRECLK